MLDLLVQPIYNAIRGAPINTNNLVAKLHYKVTSSVLVIVGFLITSVEHFGNAIDCVQNIELVPRNVLHTYCWIHSTFTLPEIPNAAHPGVYKIADADGSKPVYHKYYQWVCLVLIMQSFFFYMPRYLWRLYERGFFTQLCATEDPYILTNYFVTHRKTHYYIATYFHFTELLFLFNLICQIAITHIFLNYQFIPLGIMVFKEPGVLIRIFPRLAKCTFHSYGPSGDIQRQDALCLLSQNVFNEKIFLFLWFWYLLLLILSVFVTIWRLTTLCAQQVRVIRLIRYSNRNEQHMLDEICQSLDFCDWYVLTTVSKNLSPIACRRLYIALYTELTKPEKHYSFDNTSNGYVATAASA
ncbi:innexin inx2-like [Tropilaelaps mercedesae]|uniref:Innexin n=1 Tax=Tropilaelaps mercedesae TaxID=418985 RepID=A0A1V9WYG6_9ACAR|nr:innexin inx2-like [Tropilaelaps mercedesae]